MRHGKRPGFTVLELVVVMSMMSVFMLLIAATLWGAIRVERADAAAFHRMLVQTQLADQFREDVASAVSVPQALGELTAGPTCLVLKTADARHVVYRWHGERLRRIELVGEQRSELPLATGGETISVAFTRSADDRVITMRLVELRGPRGSQRERPVEISAALGGDLR